MNPWSLLHALARRWKLAAILAPLLAAAAAAVAYFVAPAPKYSASALVQLAPEPGGVIPNPVDAQIDIPAFQRTQLTLITTREFLAKVFEEPGISDLETVKLVKQEDRPSWLKEKVAVDFSSGNTILRISLSGEEPADLPLLINTISDVFLREFVVKKRTAQETALKNVQAQYTKIQDSIRGKQKELQEVLTKLGVVDVADLVEGREHDVSNLGDALHKLDEVREHIRELDEELVFFRKKTKPTDREAAKGIVENRLSKDPDITTLTKRMAEVKLQLLAARREGILGEEHAKMQGYKNELATIVESLDAAIEKKRPEVVKELREEANEASRKGMQELQDKLLAFQHRRNDLQARINELKQKNPVGAANDHIKNLQNYITEWEKRSHVFETTIATLSLGIELRAPEGVVEKAVVPREKTGRSKKTVAALAASAALCFACFTVAWWELRNRRLEDVEEAAFQLGTRVIGTLPVSPKSTGIIGMLPARRTKEAYFQNLLTSSVDGLTAMLMNAAAQDQLRVIMVTSAVAGEGKSTVSSHLAISLARAGRKTLLIDGDLRKPSLHRLFDTHQSPGLQEYLRGEVQEPEASRPSHQVGLSLMTAGTGDVTTIRTLSEPSTAKRFASLKDLYEFVIVDSAPTLPVADSLLIGQHVDAVIVSVLRNVSRLPTLWIAYQRLIALGIRIIGVVANGIGGDLYHQEYSYYGYGESGSAKPSKS